MRIAVAIPAYDRKIHVETARSLLNEQAAAYLMGDELETIFAPGCSLITMARNQLSAKFLQGNYDKLVFVDSDVSWETGHLLRLAHHPVDFVGGAYRYKDDEEGYPVTWLQKDELWSSELGLIEVRGLPGGFLALTPKVFEVLREKFANREYTFMGEKLWAYFHAPWRDGHLYGEDASFCAEWSEADGQVWLDPELSLTHLEGGKAYKGHIGNWLKSRGT